MVLLFSSSYVFRVLSAQFALTVALGIAHGLVLLPVMLSFLGPKAFASAEQDSEDADDSSSGKPIAETSHAPEGEDNSSEDGNKKANEELES